MQKPRAWETTREYKLITLRLPASYGEIDKFLEAMVGRGKVPINFDPEEGWLYAEYSTGTSLQGGKEID